MLILPDTQQLRSTNPITSASAWSTPYVLMSLWGAIQLWLYGSSIESLSKDLIRGLIYSSVIAATILPVINRTVSLRLATGKAHKIIEDTLGCLLAVLTLSILLATILLAQSQFFRDPLDLAIQLTGVALMANCWILATVLLSSAKHEALLNSFLAAITVLFVALFYQPTGGLSYHALAWLTALAVMLLWQARALSKFLPRPSKIGLSLLSSLPTSLELSVASTGLCIALWLSRPSAHSLWQTNVNMQLLENCQSISYLVLLPVAMLAWSPLEQRYKSALYAFEQAANGGGNLATLDYQKSNLITQSLSGMQRLYIVLIAAAAVALTFNHLIVNGWMKLSSPNWLLALSLVHVGLQMIILCTIRLLFYLQRDRELLLISMLHLVLITISVSGVASVHNASVLSFSLVVSSGIVCLFSVGLLRHRLHRLDYLFFMKTQQVMPAKR